MMMQNGRIRPFSSLSFSASGMFSSCSGSGGARAGFSVARMMM